MKRGKKQPRRKAHWCSVCRGGLVPGPDVIREGRSFATMKKCDNDRIEETQLPLPTIDAQQRRAGERDE